MIRTSTPADIEDLFAIWEAAVLATHDFLTPDDFREIAKIVGQQYLPATGFWVAVDEGGRPVGFMGMTASHIDALFVDPQHHGQGTGRALVEHVAALHGALSVDVNEQNDGAVAFYEKLGFTPTGRSPTDEAGRPYPILHLRRSAKGR